MLNFYLEFVKLQVRSFLIEVLVVFLYVHHKLLALDDSAAGPVAYTRIEMQTTITKQNRDYSELRLKYESYTSNFRKARFWHL